MAKLNFDDALQAVNEQQCINSADVQARALQRFVWVAEWHIPGCLPESFGVHTRKADALADALGMCGNARGAATELRKYGRTERVAPDAYVSMAVTTIERRQLFTLF